MISHSTHCIVFEIIYIYHMYSYLLMYIFLVGHVFFDRGIECDISYMLSELYHGYPHQCANWHYQVILHMYHIVLLVYLLHLRCLLLYLQLVHGLKCCMLKVFLYCMYIFFYIFIHIL